MTYGEFIDGTFTHPATEAALAAYGEGSQPHDMLHTCFSTPEFVAAIGPGGVGFDEPLSNDYREGMQRILCRKHGIDDATAFAAVCDAEIILATARRDERNTRLTGIAKKIITLGFADIERR